MRFERPRSRTRSLSYYRRGQLLPQCAPPKPVSKICPTVSASCTLASTLKLEFSIFEFQLVVWPLRTRIIFYQNHRMIWYFCGVARWKMHIFNLIYFHWYGHWSLCFICGGSGSSVHPSPVVLTFQCDLMCVVYAARAIEPENWRALMDTTREVVVLHIIPPIIYWYINFEIGIDPEGVCSIHRFATSKLSSSSNLQVW